jgi:lipopolysaccharide transport system ATP-binding protein
MTQVTAICTQLILLNKGQIEFLGSDIGEGVEKYFLKFDNGESQIVSTKDIVLRNATLSAKNAEYIKDRFSINTGETLTVNFELKLDTAIKRLRFRLGIFNIEYRLLAEVDSEQVNFITENTGSGIVKVSVQIENLFLRYGKYSIHLHVTDVDTSERILRQTDIASFVVKETLAVGADFLLPSKWNLQN